MLNPQNLSIGFSVETTSTLALQDKVSSQRTRSLFPIQLWHSTCRTTRSKTVDLYKSIAKVDKLKHATTPFVPDTAITPADEETKGELAPNACRILMKALWLARLARPDIN